MRDLPIPFSAPMNRALLDGRKKQTRRKLRVPPPFDPADDIDALVCAGSIEPQYRRGDRLWVREAWRTMDGLDALSGAQIAANCHEAGYPRAWCPIQYEADGARTNWLGDPHTFGTKPGRYRHARFMPRWASRLTLLVTDVRVQRLRQISEADAMAEGMELDNELSAWRCYLPKPSRQDFWLCPRESFRTLWDSLHGQGAWNENPWVCATTFTVHPANIDTLEAGHA